MISRGDHKIFHEPWVTSYMYRNGMRDIFSRTPSREIIDTKNYQDVKALIYSYAVHQPVFLKDMIWCMGEEFLNDEALLSDPSVFLTFLIRDPAISIQSWFLKGEEKMSFERTLEIIHSLFRYDYLVRIAEKYREIRGVWPIIIEAEDLCSHPQATIKAFCERACLPFLPEALFWEKGMPEEWEHLRIWHLDAANSSHFFVPTHDEIKGYFSLTSPEFIPSLEAIEKKQRPFYDKLRLMKDALFQ